MSFKFLIRFVLPLMITTRNIRSKMKDVRPSPGETENNQSMNSNSENTKDYSSSKGDYIDFEEIK